MSTKTEVPANEPIIVMSRTYDAPRDRVWEAMTNPKHVAQWWGGPGFTNPVCEMDVRAGGRWHHVMRFPEGNELQMNFVFVEVDKPRKLVWQDIDHDKRRLGRPTSLITVTLEDLGERTGWKIVARFHSFEDREAAVAIGFSKPIEASNNRLVEYLKNL